MSKSITKTTPTAPKLAAIRDFTTTSNQGIILINQSTMQDIYKNSGPLANSNEFQTHYWCLTLRFVGKDSSILDIAIPTVYFNYEQFVTPAHIDFEMKDVSAISEKLLPVHNMKVNELLATSIITDLEELLHVKFETISTDINSIHRHPGSKSSQRFSGTDLDKKAENHGVVYPLATATNKSNFAGIMTIDSGECNVAHYEYRVATGTLGTDLTYVKGRCLAIVINDNQSEVEKLLNSNTNYSLSDNSKTSSSFEMEIASIFRETNFKAFTQSVVPEHVKKAPTINYFSKYAQPTKTTAKDVQVIPDYYEPSKLSLLTKVELIKHAKDLDKYYYGKAITYDYTRYQPSEIIEMIQELYVEIMEEEASVDSLFKEDLPTIKKELPIGQVKKTLASYGLSESLMTDVPEATLRKWLENTD